MNAGLKFLLTTLIFLGSISLVPSALAISSVSSSENTAERDAWLKLRFSEQHQKLIPVVAVADMFFSCDRARNYDDKDHLLNELVEKMDRGVLAEKLADCLGEDGMKSDVALNFGLLGCFHAQLAHLPEEEKQQKMKLVKQAISSLSRSERQRSFTHCVTEQAIHYLK